MCPGGVTKIPTPAQSLKPAFDVLDADRDGRISVDDLRAFYEVFPLPNGPPADEETIRSMMSMADENDNGFVEYEEFERVLETRRIGRVVGFGCDFVEEIFKVMDGDGDGKVGFEDLRRWLREVGMVVSEEEIMAMVRFGGGDSGGVTCDRLRRILGLGHVVAT